MSRTTILPIQRVMANAAPGAWRDGIVVETRTADAVVAFLDGGVTQLRLASADGFLSSRWVMRSVLATLRTSLSSSALLWRVARSGKAMFS